MSGVNNIPGINPYTYNDDVMAAQYFNKGADSSALYQYPQPPAADTVSFSGKNQEEPKKKTGLLFKAALAVGAGALLYKFSPASKKFMDKYLKVDKWFKGATAASSAPQKPMLALPAPAPNRVFKLGSDTYHYVGDQVVKIETKSHGILTQKNLIEKYFKKVAFPTA